MSLHLRWAAAVGLCLIAALIVVLILLVLGQSDRSPRTQTSAPAPEQSDQPQGLTDDVARDSGSQPGDDDDRNDGYEAVRSADSDTTEPIGQDTGSADTTYAEQQPETDENSSAAGVTAPAAQARVASEDADAPLAGLTVTAGTTTQTLWPAFSRAVQSYTIPVENAVTRITIEATPDSGATVAYQNLDGTALTDADMNTAGQQVGLPAVGARRINVVVTRGIEAQAYTVLLVRQPTADAAAPCSAAGPSGGDRPAPTPVAIGALPIVVESTTDQYFVLYVRSQTDPIVEAPVSVTLGRDGATTLAENVAALPIERYRVEQFLIADPADIDGDCIDDITELADPIRMNPINPAPGIELSDGAMAVPDRPTFEALSYQKEQSPQGSEYVKFVLLGMNTDRPRAYFLNGDTHRYHQTFRDALGLAESGLGMVSGTIVYHPNMIARDGSAADYHYEFWPLTTYAFNTVARSHTVLAANMPLLDDNLVYYMPPVAIPASRREFARYEDSRISLVFDEDIAPESGFISLNPAAGYGFLRVMEPGERPDPRDVVIYAALPNELSRVAGIITTVPQTPLSHVNLRAVQDGVPNAYIRGALTVDEIVDLIGAYVRYSVGASGYSIRAATRAEVDQHFAAARPAEAQTTQRNLSVTSITALRRIAFEDWTAFGVKAANVAVLGTFGFLPGTIPDGFAVPFYFYDEFMKFNGFYSAIETLLADPDFRADLGTQAAELKTLREAIRVAPMPGWITAALTTLQESFPEGTSIRCRSSTNNEDLPRFSGAGLYDSRTQHPDEGHISKCIKQVYASLWNFRAFTERDFHRIDHLATAMGVLLHPNYSDERANGVAVSFDPVYGSDATYYVNTQVGEDLVTNPDALSMPEEVLLKQAGGHTVVAASNQMPPGQPVMNVDHLGQLRAHLAVIHERFAALYNVGPDEQFAIEIEFKITSDNRLAIKQARPWIFSAAASAPER